MFTDAVDFDFGFQSLFCWMMLCNLAKGKTAADYLKFQSLFCWMMLCNETTTDVGFTAEVSILVLLDDALQLYCVSSRVKKRYSVSILVLLDDALQLNIRSPVLAKILVFQSLFCWMMLCNPRYEGMTCCLLEFQSLFCWMMLCNIIKFFQSPPYDEVSILVLLDDALQPDITPAEGLRPDGFNPCFVG